MKIYGIETRRYDTPEYNELVNEVKPRIERLFNTEVHSVRAYNTKEFHGDMDLLVLNTCNLGKISEKLKSEFNLSVVHNNGSVYSFEYKDFQIDIIPQPTKNWETAKCFFDFDPSGNLMGKLAKKFGLKYGFQGLVYPFRNFDGRLTKDIVISRDNRKIFEFLGLSYDRYLETFDTVEEIFDYIVGSEYFNGDNFLMENLNHVDRKRNRKRTTYQGFLTYINEKRPANKFEFSKNKEDYHLKIEMAFPEANFLNRLEELKKEDDENIQIKEKFNGRLVMEWFPHLQGKNLGDALGHYKQFLGEAYRRFMLNSTAEEVKSHFTTWLTKYRN